MAYVKRLTAYVKKSWALALVAAPVAALVGTVPARAAETKVAGSFDASMVQQNPRPLDAPDHLVVSELAKGTHAQDGTPLAGADVLISENIVIDKGNGPEQGTISLITDKGSITNEIHGTVKTVMVDGQPRTTVSGVYKMINGTGMFAGGKGQGTFQVAFKSKTDFHSDYRGVLSLPRKSASR